MAVNPKEQMDVANSSSSSTAVVEQLEDHVHNEKERSYDLEAGQIVNVHSHSLSGGEEDDDSSSHHSHSHSHEDDDDDDSDNDNRDTSPPVTRISTNVSLGPDNPVEHYTSFVEVPDSVYDRIPNHRKLVIVALLSYCAFLAPISSTTVLSATPEVAAEFHTTGSIVDVTNALYMLFMGISPIVWGPFSEVWGRKVVSSVHPPLPSPFSPPFSLSLPSLCFVRLLEPERIWETIKA